jgi:hypothetical protein
MTQPCQGCNAGSNPASRTTTLLPSKSAAGKTAVAEVSFSKSVCGLFKSVLTGFREVEPSFLCFVYDLLSDLRMDGRLIIPFFTSTAIMATVKMTAR